MWNAYSNRSTGVAIGFDRIKSRSKKDVVLKCWYDTTEFAKEMEHSEVKVETEFFQLEITVGEVPVLNILETSFLVEISRNGNIPAHTDFILYKSDVTIDIEGEPVTIHFGFELLEIE